MGVETTIRVVVILLGTLLADRQASAVRAEPAGDTPSGVEAKPKARRPCGVARTDACLVLTYEVSASLDPLRHDVWFLDTLGRRFSFSRRSCEDPLAMALGRGSIRPKDFAALVARSHQAGPALSPSEVDHLLSLLAESRSIPAREDSPNAGCKDGGTARIRGYWTDPDGRASSFYSLWEFICDKVVLQNPSPAAQQLVQWVHDHAQVPKDRGPGAEMDPHEVADYVASQRPKVTACYESALKTSPKLSGRIAIYWTIDVHGVPRGIGVESNSMEASSVPDCLRALIKKWRFQKPCGNVEVSYPFVFMPP